MEEQDKFNQASENEPIKQSIEQPTADTDSKPNMDATAQSTSVQTDDSCIVWDPKRPGCLDLKYYRKYWRDIASVCLIGFGLIFIIAKLIIDLTVGKFDRTSIQEGIHVISVITPAATLMLMSRRSFRFRRPEALVLRSLQSAYTIICLSCIIGILLFRFKYGIMSAESCKIDLGQFFFVLCIIITISSGILYSFCELFVILLEAQEDLNAIPTGSSKLDTGFRICLPIGIMILPIIVHIVLTIIAFG